MVLSLLFFVSSPFPSDNAAVHQKEAIEELASEVGSIVLFLPPYSPGEHQSFKKNK